MEIKIDNGLKKIKVNDAGDYIEFSVRDNKFIDGLGKFVIWLEDTTKTTEKKEEKDVMLRFQEERKQCKEACKKLDELLGENTCNKVFGNVEPDIYLIAEFCEKLLEYVQQFTEERKEAIDKKYNNNRKGANSQ